MGGAPTQATFGVGRQQVTSDPPGGTTVAPTGPVLSPRLLPSLFALVLLAACGFDPGDDSPMTPPPAYREWWAKTEACSGLSGEFDRVNWSVVPGHSFDCASGKCAGHWEPGHRIYLAEDFAMNEMVVRHEMLHDLLGRSGHPDPPFGNPCPLTWASWQGDRAQLPDTLVQDLSAF